MRHRVEFAGLATGLVILSAVTTLGLGLPQSFDAVQGEDVERFLTQAKFVRLGKTLGGVTLSRQAILELDGVTRFGVFKTIDESRSGYTQLSRGGEINFQDSWRTEIPAYELDKLLRLRMVPVTVERTYNGATGSLQAWVDLGMSEAERLKKKIGAPDVEAWNRQIHKVRMFDNLIYNTDRHSNNIWISKDWNVILIDHSRAFRNFGQLRAEGDLTRFSRSLLEAMEKLDRPTLIKLVSQYLTPYQIDALLQRRDLIVQRARRLAADKGEAAVLFP
ncbi:MAG: hypothetical protein A3H97_21435 [Acidobacteria bacterium RIFCSPLOWO2_02_FULL_65_29]|nr:MAG: hypothetical protein A3H97_21435 [Acidobacteria bacterium RIFCSPLOWO2_02_FULL_65_29]